MLKSDKLHEFNLSELTKAKQKEVNGGHTEEPCSGGHIDPSDPETWGSTGPFNPCEN
jgi:hypothetical protein